MSEEVIDIRSVGGSRPGISYSEFCIKASLCLVLLVLAVNVGYVLFGHTLIAAIYDTHSPLADHLMSGRADTPLMRYFDTMDQQVLRISGVLAAVAIGLVLSRNLLGVLLSIVSLLVGSLVIFAVLEVFPPLVPALHFDLVPYFKYRLDHVPDPELGMLERPLKHYTTHNFRGSAYSPLYRIEEPPRTVIVDTDELGFRNQPGITSADVVVLGSSFPAHGDSLKDTYAKKLEAYTNGLVVSNLGMGGYGPLEFVKVLKRFALPKKPQVAILMFHTGDVERFLKMQVTGEEDYSVRNRRRVFGSFFSRWTLALEQTWNILGLGSWSALQARYQTVVGTEAIHPDVAVLELPGGKIEHLVILNQHTGAPPEQLLKSEVWRTFGEVLREFKNICRENHIVPVLAYVPWSTEVYAEYTTLESGYNWRTIRDSQIASSTNDEEAARRLASEVGIDLISFLPAFKDAARQGKLVYLRTDTHWNHEGIDIAARVTAEALRGYVAISEP